MKVAGFAKTYSLPPHGRGGHKPMQRGIQSSACPEDDPDGTGSPTGCFGGSSLVGSPYLLNSSSSSSSNQFLIIVLSPCPSVKDAEPLPSPDHHPPPQPRSMYVHIYIQRECARNAYRVTARASARASSRATARATSRDPDRTSLEMRWKHEG